MKTLDPKPAGAEERLFDGGPPLGLLRLWGRFDPDNRHEWQRAGWVAVIGWVPLLLLAYAAHLRGHQGVWTAFLNDSSVHARTLVAAPLMVLAEALAIPRLGGIAQVFRQRGLVPQDRIAAYDEIVRSTVRWRDAWQAEALAVVIAYAASALLATTVPPSFLPDWHRAVDGGPLSRSLASWWNMLVSLPILVILILGWGWRFWLWAHFLRRVSRLDLQLLASHPEGAAGLMFVSDSLRAFSLLGMALGTLVASTEVAHVVAGGTDSAQQLAAVALATVVTVVLLFCLPLLTFVGPLVRCWRDGSARYGRLAQQIGMAFEHKWLRDPRQRPDDDLLSSPDFSAMTDFFQTAGQVTSMRLLPINLRRVVMLSASTFLPFALVAMAMVPFDKLLDKLMGLLL